MWLKLQRFALPYAWAYLSGQAAVEERFKEEQATELSRGFTPIINTKWALTNFNDWIVWRNTTHPDDQVPMNILECNNTDEL